MRIEVASKMLGQLKKGLFTPQNQQERWGLCAVKVFKLSGEFSRKSMLHCLSYENHYEISKNVANLDIRLNRRLRTN